MARRIEITLGDVFGYLTLLKEAPEKRNSYGQKVRMMTCTCICGKQKDYPLHLLRSGGYKHCGCKRNARTKGPTKAEHKRSPTFRSWRDMFTRCYNEKDKWYHRYGGRGIVVSEGWHIFDNFVRDMGEKPDGFTLERVDSDGNYSPENCKWATPLEQGNNTCRNKFVTVLGETKTIAQWSRDPRCMVPSKYISRRLLSGWSAEKAILFPVKKRS